MLQLTPQMRILVAIDAVDGRKGIDSLVQLCRETLSRSATSIRLLAYDGQGFWLAQKRLSKGRFRWWPSGKGPARSLEAYQAQLLLAAGDPDTKAAPMWRRVS
jgi:transposase